MSVSDRKFVEHIRQFRKSTTERELGRIKELFKKEYLICTHEQLRDKVIGRPS